MWKSVIVEAEAAINPALCVLWNENKVKWSVYARERKKKKKKNYEVNDTRTTMRRIQNKQILNITSCSTNTWAHTYTIQYKQMYVRSRTPQHAVQMGRLACRLLESICSIGDGWHCRAKRIE